MAKQSQIEKAIAQLEYEMAIIQLAIARLKAQQPAAKKAPKPRAVTTVAEHKAG